MSFSESSPEYDLFENMRRRLARLLAAEGWEEIEAERAALYVMQGVREVPRLLNALASSNTSDAGARDILNLVLEGAASLERARALLLREDELTNEL
jgi:hypothetical protein